MKVFLLKLFKRLGFKNLDVMKYGLKHGNLKLLFDGIFFGKYQYQYIRETTLHHAKSFEKTFKNKKYKENLVNGLDEKSIREVEQIEKNIKFILSNPESHIVFYRKDFGIRKSKYEVDRYIEKYTKDIYFPVELKEESVFYFKHGINEIKNLEQRIKGKDIIDCGAYVGDSLLMFSKELGVFDGKGIVKHIYCIEPNPNNRELLNLTIKRNNLNKNVTTIPLGVGKQKETININMFGIASFIGNQSFMEGNIPSFKIDVDTIDNVVKNYGITPGLIKRDIEGLEYDAILGSEKTIKKYKPILLISIYHTGKDFYEIKPLLESWNIGYNFIVKHLSTNLFEETMLICY